MMERIGIQLEEAAGLIAEHIQPVRDVETVELAEAAGRILAREYYSDMDNPPFDRSPLDGYAFRSQDVAQAREEADRILERARVEAELEKQKMSDDVKREIIVVASLMAGKIVSASVDTAMQNQLIDETLKEMGDKTWLN